MRSPLNPPARYDGAKLARGELNRAFFIVFAPLWGIWGLIFLHCV